MKKLLLGGTAITLLFVTAACGKAKTTTNASASQTPPALTQTYTNIKAGYSYNYPSGYSVMTPSAGYFVSASADAMNTDVQEDKTLALVFSANEIDLATLNQQSLAARIKTEDLNPKNSMINQIKIGSLSGYEISDSVVADGITSNRYFVQNSSGQTIELLAVKNNPVASAIVQSFSFTNTK